MGCWRVVLTNLDIADTLGNGGSYQHRCGGNGAGEEEDGAELTFGKVEFAVEEVGHPGAVM